MSKRKSHTTMKNVDMVFEDDLEDEQEGSVASTSDSKFSVSRVSGRAKKVKTIYDPSNNNGPVHKRKKEALEALNRSNEAKLAAKPKLEVKPTIPVEAKLKSPVKVRPSLPAKVKPVLEVQSKPEVKKVVPVPVTKEPSKRIQERRPQQKTASDPKETSTSGGQAFSKFLAKRYDSLSGNSSEDYEKPAPIRASVLPEVRQWTSQQVFDHFTGKLHFSKQDCSRIFIEEEIDGEALILLKRSDIVTEKFSKLKLGTALKIWTNIQKIQTRSSDPSQR